MENIGDEGDEAGENPKVAGSTPSEGGGGTKFKLSGQVIAAIVVTAVAGNILAARRLRTTMAGMAARSAQRKHDSDRAFREARERAKQAASFGENPLRGRVPEGWEFDDASEAAFAKQRLNSQVLQKLSILGVKNFVADRREAKVAYRKRAMNLHPDRSTDSALGGGTKEGNQEEFKRVAAAYEWLEENYYGKEGR